MNIENELGKPHIRAVVVFSVFLFSFFAVRTVLNSTDSPSSLDTRTYAVWENAPSWMWPLTLMWPSEQKPARSLKLSSFTIPSPTPTPTRPPAAQGVTTTPGVYPTLPPGSSIPVTAPVIGGPDPNVGFNIDWRPPPGYYCIDDVDPDLCDDDSSHLVPYGRSGVVGTCGKVIEQTDKLVWALPQFEKGLRNGLESVVSNTCASTGTYPLGDYVSTYLIIDAYNLAGFNGPTDLSKTNPSHVDPAQLFSWWQSAPAQAAGYVYIPYAPSLIQEFGSGQRDLTGCVMFLKTGSSYHIGIVNKLELYSPGGDGVISILQAGSMMYIDRFLVAGWGIDNKSTNKTTTDGVTGFGCR